MVFFSANSEIQLDWPTPFFHVLSTFQDPSAHVPWGHIGEVYIINIAFNDYFLAKIPLDWLFAFLRGTGLFLKKAFGEILGRFER